VLVSLELGFPEEPGRCCRCAARRAGASAPSRRARTLIFEIERNGQFDGWAGGRIRPWAGVSLPASGTSRRCASVRRGAEARRVYEVDLSAGGGLRREPAARDFQVVAPEPACALLLLVGAAALAIRSRSVLDPIDEARRGGLASPRAKRARQRL
jgi:hypothetical protein